MAVAAAAAASAATVAAAAAASTKTFGSSSGACRCCCLSGLQASRAAGQQVSTATEPRLTQSSVTPGTEITGISADRDLQLQILPRAPSDLEAAMRMLSESFANSERERQKLASELAEEKAAKAAESNKMKILQDTFREEHGELLRCAAKEKENAREQQREAEKLKDKYEHVFDQNQNLIRELTAERLRRELQKQSLLANIRPAAQWESSTPPWDVEQQPRPLCSDAGGAWAQPPEALLFGLVPPLPNTGHGLYTPRHGLYTPRHRSLPIGCPVAPVATSPPLVGSWDATAQHAGGERDRDASYNWEAGNFSSRAVGASASNAVLASKPQPRREKTDPLPGSSAASHRPQLVRGAEQLALSSCEEPCSLDLRASLGQAPRRQAEPVRRRSCQDEVQSVRERALVRSRRSSGVEHLLAEPQLQGNGRSRILAADAFATDVRWNSEATIQLEDVEGFGKVNFAVPNPERQVLVSASISTPAPVARGGDISGMAASRGQFSSGCCLRMDATPDETTDYVDEVANESSYPRAGFIPESAPSRNFMRCHDRDSVPRINPPSDFGADTASRTVPRAISPAATVRRSLPQAGSGLAHEDRSLPAGGGSIAAFSSARPCLASPMPPAAIAAGVTTSMVGQIPASRESRNKLVNWSKESRGVEGTFQELAGGLPSPTMAHRELTFPRVSAPRAMAPREPSFPMVYQGSARKTLGVPLLLSPSGGSSSNAAGPSAAHSQASRAVTPQLFVTSAAVLRAPPPAG